jgi:surface antigen
MEKIRPNAQVLLSFSLFCLALAIGYFAFEVHQFLNGFPAILVQMEKTSVAITPVVNDIAETSRNILPISENLAQVAKELPAAIEEVRAVRKSLPETLDKTIVIAEKIEKTSQTLPEVLEEVRQTRQLMPGAIKKIGDVEAKIPLILAEMKKYREELPKIRKSTDQAAMSVAGITKEISEIRPFIPGILAEMEQTRKALPDMLDQAERIAAQGENFGSDASKGAVKGAVSGLVNLFNPLAISRQLRDLVLPGRNAQELTTEDIRLIRETTLEIVKNGTTGATMKWKNPKSRNEGKMSVIREFQENAVVCKEVREEIWAKKEKTHDFNVIFCQQPDGSWNKKGDPVSNQ